jgi:hypothetical protein
MGAGKIRFPVLVAHADWSVNASKRWMALAFLDGGVRYRVGAPRKVGDVETLLARLKSTVGSSGSVLLGFDFPIGLPYGYAARCAVEDFLALLPELGRGDWSKFYFPAEHPEEISLYRPFYPRRAGNARQVHLLEALGVKTMDDLRRRCELAHPGRRAAAPLFWTLGGQQVGKAAISGWRDVLAPGLGSTELAVTIWPFSGNLDELLAVDDLVIAETYPGEFYHHLGVTFQALNQSDGNSSRPRRGKRVQASRAANARALLDWANYLGVLLSTELELAIQDGFGPAKDGEDAFDAIIGLFGMLNILLGKRSFCEPPGKQLRKIEGWILGQTLGFE